MLSPSCKANVRVKLAKTGHGPHSSTLACICVVRLLFVLFYVLFVCKCVLPTGDNPIAVNKYHNEHNIILPLLEEALGYSNCFYGYFMKPPFQEFSDLWLLY